MPRYLLQRVLTGEWLTRDLELSDGQWTRALSSPSNITGFIDPELKDQVAADGRPLLLEWGTKIYRQTDDGRLMAGIVTGLNKDGSRLTIEGPGLATYPHGLPYSDQINFGRVDPMEVVRHLWFHVQNMPNAKLGVVVDQVSTPKTSWIGTNAEPYGLAWWENKDCGSELDNLAKQIPFDYEEVHAFTNAAQTETSHRIAIGYPRLGRKRSDLRFAEGDNITDKVIVNVDGDEYANEIIGIGRGEGARMIHASTALVDGRLRRAKVVTDKSADQARLDSLIETQLIRRLQVADISQVTIRDSPSARISSISPGDDILVEVNLRWGGKLRLWLRVLTISGADSDPATALLGTQRSDSFVYNATTEIS